MFITKVRERSSGLLLYGITPPKASTAPERVGEIAAKTTSMLAGRDFDALIVYDVQDEAERTSEARPFPFASSLDPNEYASQHLTSLTVPKIIYRPAGKFHPNELSHWLDSLGEKGFYPVFVGMPSPDYSPKTTLREAYALWKKEHGHDSVIGAVTIPERHAQLHDEPVRMLDKMSCGVSYFVSQCIFNVEYARQMLVDLADACRQANTPLPTVVFTLTICGSAKTLEFMEWLGIHIPKEIRDGLLSSASPVQSSVALALSIARDLAAFCQQHQIPFGFNIESVAIRKEEIDASLGLLDSIRDMLVAMGLRTRQPQTIGFQ